VRDAELGQQLFELGDDAGLFGAWWQRNWPGFYDTLRDVGLCPAFTCIDKPLFL